MLYFAVQSQNAVTAYFTSKQILLIGSIDDWLVRDNHNCTVS